MRNDLARRAAAIVAVFVAAGAVAATSPNEGYFQTAAQTSRPLEVGLFEGQPRRFELRLRTVRGTFGAYDTLTAGVTLNVRVTEVVPSAPEEDFPVGIRLVPIDRPEDYRYTDPRFHPTDHGALPSVRSAAEVPCCEARFLLELRPVDVEFVRVELEIAGELLGWVEPEEDEPPELGADRRLLLDVVDVE